jgi:hypothetical protein
MESHPALVRNNKPLRSRVLNNSTPGTTMMDRAGRVYSIPWSRRVGIADLKTWCAHIARRAQHWWRGQGADHGRAYSRRKQI